MLIVHPAGLSLSTRGEKSEELQEISPQFGVVLLNSARHEIVAAVVGDGDVSEFAYGKIHGDEDATIDVWGVPHGAGDAFFLDEDAEFFAKLSLVDLLRYFINGGGERAMAAFLGGVVDVAVTLVGAGAFFLGVLENAATFELEGLDEVEKFLVVFFCFLREAGDEGGADGEVGNAIAHPLKEITDVSAVGFPVHFPEHVIGDMLQRDIDVT